VRALLFDCDGVLADTERDGHRVAFNQAFEEQGLGVRWNEAQYGALLQVAGGKERLQRHFADSGWPVVGLGREDQFIEQLHRDKSRIFQALLAGGGLPLRPGVVRLVDEAHAAGLKLVVCSTSSRESVLGVMDLLGRERKSRFHGVWAGDVVKRKKPDPEIYLLARHELGLSGRECLVIEDSRTGLQAALGAGLNCVITTSAYTVGEHFSGARLVVPDLGDPPGPHVTLADLARLCR
jgi:HAD superfamily hydrolase (TIGR01509 family)